MPRIQSAFLVLLAGLFLSLPASAAQAVDFVKAKQEQLTATLEKGDNATTKKKLASLFDEMLDYDTLAEASLGKHWGALSSEQKQEFTSVLKGLVQRAYRKNLSKTLSYEVKYLGQQPAKNGTLVRTRAQSKTDNREEPVSIDYVLHRVDGKWRVFDIVTEGSSLVRNYRSQFNRVIKKKGFDELLRRMKKKLAKGA